MEGGTQNVRQTQILNNIIDTYRFVLPIERKNAEKQRIISILIRTVASNGSDSKKGCSPKKKGQRFFKMVASSHKELQFFSNLT